ncbi:MAG: MFS transporter [Desulfomonilaceae bacterium]
MKLNQKILLVSFLYFAEGFPFGLIEQTLPIYFRIHGMSLGNLGLLSLVSLPYALKFLWAPAVDFIGARRQWIVLAQLTMAASIVALLPLDPSNPDFILWLTIATLSIFSATQDIAIDAYTIELLKSSEIGIANGFRQAAYRGALVIAGGMFIALGGWIGWRVTYSIAAGILLLCALASLRLPHIEVERPNFSFVSLIAPAKDLLERQGAFSVAMFILLFKLGDMSIGPMIRPFWLARGLSATEIGLITGTLGVLASIAGGLIGGLFMARFGIYAGLWTLGILQSLSNLSYVLVAAYPHLGNFSIYIASVTESFCGGLGSAAFLSFLMSVCKKEFSATQYALLSAIFRISGIIVGALSGWTTMGIGYSQYFILTFFFSLPAFAFIRVTKKWIPSNGTGSGVE